MGLLKGQKDVSDATHLPIEFVPGRITGDQNFIKAYTAMAERAGWTLAEAAAKRYDDIAKELTKEDGAQSAGLESERQEIEKPKDGKPNGVYGSEEYKQWFEDWASRVQNSSSEPPHGQMALLQHMLMMQQQPQSQPTPTGKKVR